MQRWRRCKRDSCPHALKRRSSKINTFSDIKQPGTGSPAPVAGLGSPLPGDQAIRHGLEVARVPGGATGLVALCLKGGGDPATS